MSLREATTRKSSAKAAPRKKPKSRMATRLGTRADSTSLTLLGALLVSGASTAHAAEAAPENEQQSAAAESTQVEEIIVTARKRSERMQDTPIAITAFSAAELEKRNLSNIVEVGAYTPNVIMNESPGSSGGGNNAQIYIRGVGQSDFLFTTDPGVGIYVDGVFRPRTLGSVLDLLDLESVEVLRGPQGTLFGKNTIGGAIVLTTQKPKGDNSGYVEVTTGRFDRLDLRASYDLPIGDRMAARLSVSSKNRDGIGKRLEFGTDKVLDESGNENLASARLAFRYTGDAVTVDLSGDYTREREKGVPVVLRSFDDTNAFGGLGGLWNLLVGLPGGLPMSSNFVIGNRYDSYATNGNKNTLDAWGVDMNVNWEISPNLSAKSITAYRKMNAFFNSDTDGSPLHFAETNDTQDQHQFSQEVQLVGSSLNDRLKWMVGAFYFSEYGRDVNEVRLASGLYDALENLPGPLNGSPLTAPTAPGGPGNPINILLDLDLDVFNEIHIKSFAGFTQGTFALTDQLSLTAGARYSHETKDYFLNHLRHNAQVPTIANTLVSANWSSFTPMGSIEFKITPDVMTYVSVTKGFKSGGFNGRPISQAQVDSFAPEQVVSYEAGFKSELADRRVRLNGALFYADYTDMQLGSISADSTGNLVLRIQNAGKSRIQGFELEMQARPSANFDLVGSVGYTDIKIKELDPGVVDITLDTRPVKTPKWNASFGAQYTWDVGASGSLSLRGDWTYQSKVYQDVQNTESIASAAHSVFNTRLTYENLKNDWELSLFVTNLLDKTYAVHGYQTLTSFGTTNLIFGRPREWGLSFKKRF